MLLLIIILMEIAVSPVHAMNIYDDPRSIYSYKDKQLASEVDILHVATKLKDNEHLIFQVKTRGERENGNTDDYVLLKILHDQTYALIIPVNKASEQNALLFSSQEQKPLTEQAAFPVKFDNLASPAGFSAKHIDNGIEFSIPIDWINFGAIFSYDVYTIQAYVDTHQLSVIQIYDRARKGRKDPSFPAFTLLNRLCSPKR